MFDGTFGGGGHSIPLLEAHRNLKILGTDLDESLLAQCKLEYAPFVKQRRLALEHFNFVNIPIIDLKKAFQRKITVKETFDIGLLDLGFSNFQLMDEERGFSYLPERDDAGLDMRFDSSPDSPLVTASDIVNGNSELELQQIFKKFGDERFAPKLANAVISARAGTIISSTGELKEVIRSAFTGSSVHDSNQAIKRAFQAIRIAVNQEVLNLETFLDACPGSFMDTQVSRKRLNKTGD